MSDGSLRRGPPASGSSRPAVLAVDDVEANLVAVRALLDDMPCEVVLARSGNEALRQLLRREFAVILLDVQMPEMDGYEVAHHARSNSATCEIPIIFLTAANNSEGMVLRGYGSGAVDFLFKPLNPAILRSKVRVFLELHAAHRRVADAKQALEQSNVQLRELADEKALLAEQFREANVLLQSAYSELQDTHAQLVQSAKMASLGELVAGVAHEINNPLSFVLSHLDTIRKKFDQLDGEVPALHHEPSSERWQKANERLREVTPGLERIRDLVVKLRTFSRLDEGERKLVSMRECVESVLTILGHRMKNVVVETHFGVPDEVDCYASLLNQALMNLVSNAIDAMAQSGTLRISTGANGADYEISVSDTGPGIPVELRARVLDPFFTTKPVGEGTGLGLSITYSIVRKHQGTVEISDAEGGGACITIRFPR